MIVNGKMEPLWVAGSVLSMQLADILEETAKETKALEDEDEEDDDIEYDLLGVDDESDDDNDSDTD